MGLLKRFGMRGDKYPLLLFSDNFRNVSIEEGYTKIGRYFHNFRSKEGIEANLSEPINEMKNGKFKRLLYPAYYDNASGFKLHKEDVTVPLKTGWETKYYRKTDGGSLVEIPESEKEKADHTELFWCEMYPGMPHNGKDGETKFYRWLKFRAGPMVATIVQHPGVTGSMVDSNIFGDAVQLNPPLYKYIILGIAMFALGYAM